MFLRQHKIELHTIKMRVNATLHRQEGPPDELTMTVMERHKERRLMIVQEEGGRKPTTVNLLDSYEATQIKRVDGLLRQTCGEGTPYLSPKKRISNERGIIVVVVVTGD